MVLREPRITQVSIAESLGVTTRAVKKNIRELADNGILTRVGSARSGYWQVKEENED